VGKPQAVKSEEELAEKEAIREGTQVLLKAPKQPKRSHPRRSLTNTGQTTQGELQLQQIQRNSSSLHRNGSSNNTSKSAVTRGMVLPFQPLSISFDDISYYVDMPVVCYCNCYFAYFLCTLCKEVRNEVFCIFMGLRTLFRDRENGLDMCGSLIGFAGNEARWVHRNKIEVTVQHHRSVSTRCPYGTGGCEWSR
jgi:hypothetical protein